MSVTQRRVTVIDSYILVQKYPAHVQSFAQFRMGVLFEVITR